MDAIDRQILTGYFALTSLCTCGLGDIVPISNSERLAGSFFLLFGVSLYSYIKDTFSEMILYIENFDNDYDETTELMSFLELFRKFNFGFRLKNQFERQLIEFFEYKWKNDRNYCILTGDD